MAAWRANPPIKWRCRCHGAFPSNIHPPIAQRGLRSSSSILFPFSRSMEPRLSVDIITHRHIGPATILTSFLDRSSWTSGSFQLVALHGASCRNNRPAYMSQLSEDDSTLPSYIPPALRDSACTNWCEVHNENMWQGPSFPSPSGSCSNLSLVYNCWLHLHRSSSSTAAMQNNYLRISALWSAPFPCAKICRDTVGIGLYIYNSSQGKH